MIVRRPTQGRFMVDLELGALERQKTIQMLSLCNLPSLAVTQTHFFFHRLMKEPDFWVVLLWILEGAHVGRMNSTQAHDK